MNLTLEKSEAIRLFPTATPIEKIWLENNFGKEIFSGNIMDRCKTFDDLCRECGTTEKAFNEKYLPMGLDQDTIAYEMLKIMTKAFNQGKKVDYSNSNQYKYWPVHDLSSGCRFVTSYYDFGYAITNFGPRLSFLDKAYSDYCATQFPEIFKYLLT